MHLIVITCGVKSSTKLQAYILSHHSQETFIVRDSSQVYNVIAICYLPLMGLAEGESSTSGLEDKLRTQFTLEQIDSHYIGICIGKI